MPRNERSSDLSVQISFYEGLLRRDPENGELLKVMGDSYTRIGEYQKGLEIDLRLARMFPQDAMVHYNLACSHSLMGDMAAALKALDQAIVLGYDDWDWIRKDPDLKALRELEEYKKILEKGSSSKAAK